MKKLHKEIFKVLGGPKAAVKSSAAFSGPRGSAKLKTSKGAARGSGLTSRTSIRDAKGPVNVPFRKPKFLPPELPEAAQVSERPKKGILFLEQLGERYLAEWAAREARWRAFLAFMAAKRRKIALQRARERARALSCLRRLEQIEAAPKRSRVAQFIDGLRKVERALAPRRKILKFLDVVRGRRGVTGIKVFKVGKNKKRGKTIRVSGNIESIKILRTNRVLRLFKGRLGVVSPRPAKRPKLDEAAKGSKASKVSRALKPTKPPKPFKAIKFGKSLKPQRALKPVKPFKVAKIEIKSGENLDTLRNVKVLEAVKGTIPAKPSKEAAKRPKAHKGLKLKEPLDMRSLIRKALLSYVTRRQKNPVKRLEIGVNAELRRVKRLIGGITGEKRVKRLKGRHASLPPKPAKSFRISRVLEKEGKTSGTRLFKDPKVLEAIETAKFPARAPKVLDDAKLIEIFKARKPLMSNKEASYYRALEVVAGTEPKPKVFGPSNKIPEVKTVRELTKFDYEERLKRKGKHSFSTMIDDIKALESKPLPPLRFWPAQQQTSPGYAPRDKIIGEAKLRRLRGPRYSAPYRPHASSFSPAKRNKRGSSSEPGFKKQNSAVVKKKD